MSILSFGFCYEKREGCQHGDDDGGPMIFFSDKNGGPMIRV